MYLTYYILHIDSARFMANSLSDLVINHNLPKGIHRIKFKSGYNDKKCDTYGIKYEYCDCFLEYINFKNDIIEFKNYQHKFGEKLKERFFNTYKFSNHDKSKFMLSLWKGVYPDEYLDDWEKFNETFLQLLKYGKNSL